MSWLVNLLSLAVTIKSFADFVMKFASTVTQWYIDRQTTTTLAEIADAAAASARAQTQEDRINAAKLWQKALNRPRYLE